MPSTSASRPMKLVRRLGTIDPARRAPRTSVTVTDDSLAPSGRAPSSDRTLGRVTRTTLGARSGRHRRPGAGSGMIRGSTLLASLVQIRHDPVR